MLNAASFEYSTHVETVLHSNVLRVACNCLLDAVLVIDFIDFRSATAVMSCFFISDTAMIMRYTVLSDIATVVIFIFFLPNTVMTKCFFILRDAIIVIA